MNDLDRKLEALGTILDDNDDKEGAFFDVLYAMAIRIRNLEARIDTRSMAGQEWYDRFKQGLVADQNTYYHGDILAIARRAAGLE